MFNIKYSYVVMHKVQVHNKTISYLVYGSCVCTSDNPLAKTRELSSRTASYRGRINMTFIWATKIKHVSTDQIKTAFDATSGVALQQRYTLKYKKRRRSWKKG